MVARLLDRLPLRCAAAVLLLADMAVPYATHAAEPGVIYCCDDANGRRICGVPLPYACYGRGYQVIKQGVVIQRVAAPLTDEERRQRDLAAAEHKKEEEARRMQQWQDRALLETYPTLDSLNAAEKDVLTRIDRQLSEIKERQNQLSAKITGYEQDVAAGHTPDPEIRITMEASKDELQRMKNNIKLRENDRQNIVDDFAEKRKRYKAILATQENNK